MGWSEWGCGVVRRLLVCAAGVLLCAAAGAHAADGGHYSVAVVPQFPSAQIESAWKPFLARLSSDMGVTLELRLQASIPQFETAFLAGEPDFIYLNPYHQVMAKRRHGYLPLLRDDSSRLVGIVLVRRDSPLQSIKELGNKTVAFPAPNAFCASLYTRTLLGELYHLNIQPQYLGTHTEVIKAVLSGEALAGGVVNTTLKREPAEVREQLRSVYETPAVMPHPLSAHPRVPAAVRERMASSVLNMTHDEAGRKLLEAIQMPSPVRANYARDYVRLEHINLKKYVVESPDKAE